MKWTKITKANCGECEMEQCNACIHYIPIVEECDKPPEGYDASGAVENFYTKPPVCHNFEFNRDKIAKELKEETDTWKEQSDI